MSNVERLKKILGFNHEEKIEKESEPVQLSFCLCDTLEDDEICFFCKKEK